MTLRRVSIVDDTRNRRIRLCGPARGAQLDASGAAEPDRHAIVLDDDRHRTPPIAVPEHALQVGRVLLDVDVFERNVPPLIVGPGGLRVGSGVFAEDVDHVR